MICHSIIGTPSQDLWPKESDISSNQFTVCQHIPWIELIGGADLQAIDLLSVSQGTYTLHLFK